MRMPDGYKQRRVFICPGIQVFLQMELGFRVKIYNPLLVTLAEDNAFPFFKINIRSVKFYQFSDPRIPVEFSISMMARFLISLQSSRSFSKSSSAKVSRTVAVVLIFRIRRSGLLKI